MVVATQATTADAQTGATHPAVSRVEREPLSSAERAPVISAIAISPDGRLLATAGDDHCVRLWNFEDGALLHVLRGHRDWVRTLLFLDDGRALVSAGNDGAPVVWSTEDGRLRDRLPAFDGPIYALACDRARTQLAMVGVGGRVGLVTLQGSKLASSFDTPSAELRGVAYSPDETHLAVAGRPGVLLVFDRATHKRKFAAKTALRRVHTIAYSHDGRQIFTGGDGTTIEIWNAADGERLGTLTTDASPVRSLVCCGSDQIAAGSTDNRVRVWSLTRREAPRELTGHVGSVAALAYDAATGKLVSGGFDTRIRVWRLDEQAPQASRLGRATP